MAPDVSHLVGTAIPPVTVRLEHGTAALFAAACKDDNVVYHSEKAASAAGLAGVPVAPTYPFVAPNVNAFTDLQPDFDPAANPGLGAAIALLMAEGGLILHGEQEFIYHRQPLIGDVLVGTGMISDISTKESANGVVMTFIKTETHYADEQGEPVVTSIMTVIHRSAPPITS